ncbi:multisite-specific tRNA:(cytosine-C5)-methyltransferase [Sporothrix schenckii 1099-18]|uniref:Multisite-specific tRNA:(Cytosine-C5)-methyltransferase n=1 Tax=Sporothrix schenckii 1099-18 TaxID=1397361 RepID=A0A0F2MDH8_SPOSC|nr:multisite-specific tRNA:(cytosine-C5)-methyltransferase [Sporothrix schenckii 1099-18]KJR87139.1 multisite-specific tRNA:(cytosine-C5)-methyltransferase [Sporothrix schenckii 1099-18]
MGRGGFNKKNRGGGRGGGRSNERYNKSYPDLVKDNEKLQTYYNSLLRLDDDETEREAFWGAFRRELPHSFRFCGSKGHAQSVQKLLQTRYIPEIAQIGEYDGQPVSPPQAVPWYPDNLAWWMTTSKTVIRKFPPFAAFQKFLVSETTVGNISRQEVVSMIPPLLMDVRPGMAVLDLCAAPGSKAAQLLEMVHQGEEARVRKVMRSIEKTLAGDNGVVAETIAEVEEDAEGNDDEDQDQDPNQDPNQDPTTKLSADPGDDGRATGVLVANDADYKRSHLLVHQLKRLSSPNIIVTNHDATIYPSLRLPPLPSEAGAKQPPQQRYLKFDRILADVPCSGDGTLRKNVNMWKEWNPGNALGLHLVQVRILVRALQMLKAGGRVVYSTCSLNPVENESVVASAIALCGGSDKVEILDSSDRLPLLQRRPGLKAWDVMDKSGRQWRNWEEVEAFMATEESGGIPPSRLVPTMFANEASDKLPLERCLRVYPHLQDTGGFFIVVLQKKAEFKAKPVPNGPAVPKKQQQQQQQNHKAKAPPPAFDDATPAAETENGDSNGAGVKRVAEDDVASVDSQPVKKQKQDGEDAETGTETETKPEAKEEAAEATNGNAQPAAEAVEAVDESAAAPVVAGSDPLREAPRPKNGPHYEEPFKYLAADHPVVKDIQAFYHLSPRFPSDRFMVRNAFGEPAKAIYYTSGLVRDILVANTAGGDGGGGGGTNVKFVHGGVRMFVKQESPSAEVCRWRIQAEGLPLLSGYVGEARVVKLHKKATLKALLVEMFPKFVDGEWTKLGEVGERLPDLGMGCFVLKVEPRPEDAEAEALVGDVPLEPMALPLWKSFHSLNLMLPKEDRAAMLLRIFNDTTPLVNNSLKEKNNNAKTAEAAAPASAPAPPPGPGPSGEDATMTDAAAAAPAEAANGEDAEINAYDAEDAPSS